MKRIMVLNGSSRSHAFTDSLIQSFKAGAESRGHEVTVMELRKMNIHPCIGCLHGGKNPESPCTQSDDMDKIYVQYRKSDIIVLATIICRRVGAKHRRAFIVDHVQGDGYALVHWNKTGRC